jgi:YHS domain-containing protein
MFGWLLRLIVLWLVLRAIVRLARGIAEGFAGPASQAPPAVPLARDPICGMFVVAANAPSFGAGNEMRFFCSEKCRRAYQVKLAR